ncbi:MAG: protein kinase domain-containing protein [Phycisphaerae bacterium]|jgi:DNA-binding helix-hairpin-helix protein with protein kinase domain
MSEYRIGSGLRIRLGKKLGEGGQAVVFEVAEHSNLAAKVFSDRKIETESKLRAALRVRSPALESVAAWPIDLIFDETGKCAGYVMPKVAGAREVDLLAHPAERRIAFPESDYGFLLHVSLNLARSVAQLHSNGCVIGDLNARNVLLSSDGVVRWIDTDSFQYEINGELFACPVGSELFTPPELQGTRRGSSRLTTNHDVFGLAVLCFQLLMLGRHPYAGVPRDGRARQIPEAIVEGAYAYAPAGVLSPPPESLDINLLGGLSAMFARAFLGTQRPTADEWCSVLEGEQRRARRCAANPRHLVLGDSTRCALCALRADPFVSTRRSTAGGVFEHASTAQLMGLLDGLERPCRLADFGQSQSVEKLARRVPYAWPSSSGKVWGIALGLAGAGIAALCPLDTDMRLFSLAMGVVLGGACFGIASVRDSMTARRFTPLRDRANSSVIAYEASEREALAVEQACMDQLGPRWAAIDERKRKLTEMNAALANISANAMHTWRTAKLQEYLQSQMIRTAGIPGIGPARVATLASFGVETAADVSMATVRRVPGFGQELTRRVLDWKSSCERAFSRASLPPVPQWHIDQLRLEQTQAIALLAMELKRDAAAYTADRAQFESRLQQLANRLESTGTQMRAALDEVAAFRAS